MSDKKILRAHVRALKATLTASDHRRAARLLTERLAADDRYRLSRTVLLYASLPDEVPTADLIAHSSDKTILLPRVEGDDLVLCRYQGAAALSLSDDYHIAEPIGPAESAVHIDYALVPGMAFDGARHRLGRGKGFYDRLFADPRYAHVHKVGVCFDFQYLDSVPAEPHDRPMDDVIVIPTHHTL